MSLWPFVCSVHLCFSVRNRTHPLDEMTHKQHAGEFYLSQSAQSSRSFERTVSNSQDSGPSPNPSPAGRGVICEVTPIGLLTRVVGKFSRTEDIIFSHRAHRVHGAFWRTVSSPQKASGIQSSQSITAKEGCWVIVVRC